MYRSGKSNLKVEQHGTLWIKKLDLDELGSSWSLLQRSNESFVWVWGWSMHTTAAPSAQQRWLIVCCYAYSGTWLAKGSRQEGAER
eukprot:1753409-Amphidinium_carterae.1